MILLLRLLLSFCFDWEDISNTQDSVSSAIQTPRISSKILHFRLYFQLSSRYLDIPMKHCLSCLIYYIHVLKPLYNFLFLKYIDRMFMQTSLKKWELASLRSWTNFPSAVSFTKSPMSILKELYVPENISTLTREHVTSYCCVVLPKYCLRIPNKRRSLS